MPKTELQIETKRVGDLDPAPYNPRSISPDALDGLRHSVERFGLVEPIVWNRRTGHVVGGHQRLKVLQRLGEQETQVVVVDLAGGRGEGAERRPEQPRDRRRLHTGAAPAARGDQRGAARPGWPAAVR